jgi:hypothetical protein
MAQTKSQLDALIDRNCKTNSVSYTIVDKTADENLAMAKVWALAFKSSGRWQYDDTNHVAYPIIATALVSGQRDYTFTTDEQGNLILDIYKVMIKNPSGVYVEIPSVDQQSDSDMSSFYDGQNTTGTPTRYDKTANGIFLDCIPNYSFAGGLKVFINREGSYFTTSDTTKMPGFSGLFHEYVALEPSTRYCKRNKMFDLADRYEKDLIKMEKDIEKHYRDRSKDEIPVITSEPINSI